MRTVAVMQPYFFPYLPTYQLAHAADVFVCFDDVAFIKKGHIHRNTMLAQGRAEPFTLAVADASQNRSIAEHRYAADWSAWLKRLVQNYRRAPQFESVYPLIEAIAHDPDDNVARKNALTLRRVFEHLGLVRDWRFASDWTLPATLRGQDRVLALCEALQAQVYVNASGGRALYDAQAFAARGLALRFVEAQTQPYAQLGGGAFVPQLSMVDVLMHNPPERVREMLSACRLQP